MKLHSTNLDAPGDLVKRKSIPVALNSRSFLLDPVNGRQSFPIAGSTSLAQSSITGRRSFPSATTESFGMARDPSFDASFILQPIITPVTTFDEVLGPDKKQVQILDGPQNKSAACLKNGHVLSKFWGDVDTDNTDSTFDHDTDNTEAHQIHTQFPTINKYLDTPFELPKKNKRGRPKKQKSPTPSQQVAQGKDTINTRSYTGCTQKQHTPQ